MTQRFAPESGLWLCEKDQAASNRYEAPIRLGRRTLLGAAALGTASLALPRRAEALAPWVGYIGGLLIGWLVNRVLDTIWDSDAEKLQIGRYVKPKPNPAPTPVGRRSFPHDVDARFGNGLAYAGPGDHSKLYWFPHEMIEALQTNAISPAFMFKNWGAPSDKPFWRELSDGYIGGQWYSQLRTRYVVMRVFNNGRTPAFLPCVNEYANSAHEVVQHRHMHKAGPRLRDMIDRPELYTFDKQNDSPSNPKT